MTIILATVYIFSDYHILWLSLCLNILNDWLAHTCCHESCIMLPLLAPGSVLQTRIDQSDQLQFVLLFSYLIVRYATDKHVVVLAVPIDTLEHFIVGFTLRFPISCWIIYWPFRLKNCIYSNYRNLNGFYRLLLNILQKTINVNLTSTAASSSES